ncbi:N-carbamoyl-L-amino-acid hydrolase [Desulfuromusa kysingii]|uniref:N-carbamoyl-L-amino-acid hydrolase n=1 Tax=Desulfuromusa kysingii TaxID=37625 RepID=A0A1H4DEU3_9BACT|nr:M20 family metallo-hydrolase [Desulfuromusa kysingii]SEA71363.1 N-carbamoyl-L-amino-acid hydrolase [Desulfuromusa kysingii]
MKCQQQRLENDFTELSKFGPLENGGFTRLAFSREDVAARGWLQKKMEDAGLEVRIDAFGNISGRRKGLSALPAVVMGSHLDTVPEGGNYDGAVGVLAGLEVIRTLNDNNLETKRPIEVINFSAEESSRFGMATMGSKALAGKFDLDTLNKLVDKNGTSLYQALKECGYAADEIASVTIEPGQIHAFMEMHIEQGPVLEMQGLPIGIVTSIAAPTRFKVSIEGRADHSGNTPMAIRKDALTGASELILGVERIASKEAGEKTVGTIGYLYVTPGAMNVVPGKVELGIDIRDVNMGDKDKAVKAVIELMDAIAERRGLKISYQQLCNDEPVALSDKIIKTLKDAADKLQLPSLIMPSGAGHDAMNMARLTDTGMIFIPSVGGISHNIAELSNMADIYAGTEVLLQATLQLAQE